MRRVLAAVQARFSGFRAFLSLALFASLATACGGGVGGGSEIAARSLYWGIPVLQTQTIGFRALSRDGLTVTLQGYRADGTAYPGPVFVELDGEDEAHVSRAFALGGDVPEGGFILATTSSDAAEVFFHAEDSPEAETSRASQLADLAAPPVVNQSGMTIHPLTDLIQVSNVSGLASVITVTPFQEPTSDPGLPPNEQPPIALNFLPFETRTFDADGLSGISGFLGSFFFDSPQPFFVAADEEFFSLDVQTDVGVRERKMPSRVGSDVSLRFGTEIGAFVNNYFDFALLVRNDSDEPTTLTIESIYDSVGAPLLLTPRVVALDPHESRIEGTNGFLFGDILGDVFLFPGLLHLHIRMTTPPEVNASFRQFDPSALAYAMTVKPIPAGHVFDVSDLQGVLPGVLDVIDVANPGDVEITVDVSVLIPEPTGFDASQVLLQTLFLPPHTIQRVVVTGPFFDRDLEPVPFVGFRLTSLAPFTVTAFRERRSGAALVVYLSPRSVGNHEVAGDY